MINTRERERERERERGADWGLDITFKGTPQAGPHP
jgi:hypothetical protein